jgi:DNA modification methylase
LIPLILAHSKPGDLIIDPFMGSGSTGVSALMAHRKFMGCDLNPEAVDISEQRLRNAFWSDWPARPEDSFWEDK